MLPSCIGSRWLLQKEESFSGGILGSAQDIVWQSHLSRSTWQSRDAFVKLVPSKYFGQHFPSAPASIWRAQGWQTLKCFRDVQKNFCLFSSQEIEGSRTISQSLFGGHFGRETPRGTGSLICILYLPGGRAAVEGATFRKKSSRQGKGWRSPTLWLCLPLKLGASYRCFS